MGEDSGRAGGYSFPLGVPLVIDPLLLYGIHRAAGAWWAYPLHALFLAGVGLFLWWAVSRAQYARIRQQDPELDRLTWVLNWSLWFVILPLGAWLWVTLGGA